MPAAKFEAALEIPDCVFTLPEPGSRLPAQVPGVLQVVTTLVGNFQAVRQRFLCVLEVAQSEISLTESVIPEAEAILMADGLGQGCDSFSILTFLVVSPAQISPSEMWRAI